MIFRRARRFARAVYRPRLQRPWQGVPASYRHIAAPDLPLPSDVADWDNTRPQIRQTLLECLGSLPPRPSPLAVRTLSTRSAPGYTVEKFVFSNGVDAEVPGYLAIPSNRKPPLPAVLAIHGHGGDKEDVFGMRSSPQSVARRLAAKGYVVAAIDNYFSGERKGSGPGGVLGRLSRASTEELSLFKLNLWLGRTLWGMMLRDQQIALDYLQSRPEVDPNRIGVQGMSMGSTSSWWLAALDERIKAVVAVACFTRYRDLIATRALSVHGIYYFVPRILVHFDTEAILALIAPRPLLALTGDRDPGSPPEGIATLEGILNHFYALYGKPGNFHSAVYPNTGHVYIKDMKEAMEAWFDRFL